MLLALWFDFWNPADWAPPVPPVPPVQDTTGAGSGGYTGASHEFWEARETMLRRHLPIRRRASAPATPPPPPVLTKKIVRYNRLVRSIPKMPDMAKLRELEDQISELSLQIENQSVQSDEDALLALLLS